MFFSRRVFEDHTAESLKQAILLPRIEYAQALIDYKKTLTPFESIPTVHNNNKNLFPITLGEKLLMF